MMDIPLALAAIGAGVIFPAVLLYGISGPVLTLIRKITR